MSELPDRSRRVGVRGLDIVWHEWGEETAPVALCLHGFLDHGRSYAPVGAATRGELRLVAPDMRGHGASDWVGAGGYYHFYDYFDDMRRVADALGTERLLLAGHSMGGSVATGLAGLLGDRVRALVLLEGMGPPFSKLDETRTRLERWVKALALPAVDGDAGHRRRQRRLLTGVDDAAGKLRRFNPRLSEARALALASTFTEAVEGGRAWCFDPLHRTPAAKPFVAEEARAMWAAVKAPVLSLYGEAGFLPEGLGARHEHLRDVVTATVPGAGHNLHHDRPELVAEALLGAHRDGRPSVPPGARAGLPT